MSTQAQLPEWLQWTLKISQSIGTSYLGFLIVDTVKCYWPEIKRSNQMISIYIVMSLILLVNLFDIWIDPLIA
jgi:hypothetical protein